MQQQGPAVQQQKQPGEAGQEQQQVAVSIVILRTKARGGDGIVDVCDDRPLVHGEGVGDLQETNSEGNADQDQK